MNNRLRYLVKPFLLLAVLCSMSLHSLAQFNDTDHIISFSATPSTVICNGGVNLTFQVSPDTRAWVAHIETSKGNSFSMTEQTKGQGLIDTDMTYTIVKITDASNPAVEMNLSKVYSVTVTHTATLDVKNITSNGSCATNPIVISVENSDVGVSYQLQMFEPTASVVQTLNGNGGQLSFAGVSAPGRYVVVGSVTGCSAQMNGEIVVSPPFDNSIAVNNGKGCLPDVLNVTTTGSQLFWNYELLRDGVATGIVQAGTGSPLVFNVTTVGVYTVKATSPGCGSVVLKNDFSVFSPITPSSILGASVCVPNSTTIQVAASENGVTYYLLLNGVVQAPVSGVAGNNGLLTMGTVSAEGVYTVSARKGHCSLDMNGSVTITPGIDKSITIQAPLTGCIGGSNTITLTGSQDGVTYTLYRRGTAAPIQTQNGIGSGKVTFTGISQEGEYYVRAFMAACSSTEELLGSYVVEGLDGIVASREFCGNEPFSVSVNPVEPGVTYTLKRGNTVLQTNAAGMFNVAAVDALPGDYTISGKLGTCSEQLLPGVVRVVPPIVIQTMTGPAGAPLCSDQPYSFGVDASQAGVVYQLKNQAGVVIETITTMVDGGAVNFTTRLYAAGRYTVDASYLSGTCAPVTMNGSFTVVQAPNVYRLVNLGPACADNGLVIELNGNEAANYTLYNNGVAVATNTTGKFGLINDPGSYTIQASMNGCTVMMDGTAVIQPMPNELTFSNVGLACPAQDLILTGASQIKVGYELWRDGVYVGPRLTISTPGEAVNFGTLMTPGTYTVRAVSLVNGCWVDFSGELIIQREPVKPVLNANTLTYCGLPSGVHLSVQPESQDVWYQLYKGGVPVSGQVFGDNALNTITWSNVTAGNYHVVAGNRGGCRIESNRVIITSGGLVSYISALAPAEGCVGTEFTIKVDLAGTAPFNFTIVDDKGNIVRTVVGYNPVPPTNPISYTMKVTPSASTSYYVRNVSDVSGCTIPDGDGVASVTVYPTPAVTVSPANPQICVGQGSVELVANSNNVAGCTYVWSATTGGAALTGDRITVSPSQTTEYVVTATSPNGCIGTGRVTVVVNPLPVVDFTIPTSVCANGSPVALVGTPVGGTFTVNNVPIALFDPNQYVPDQSYVIRYEVSSGGCVVSVEKPIFVNPLPVVEIRNLQPVYCADAGTFTIWGRPDRIDNIPGRLDGYFTVNGDRFDPTDPDRFWNEQIVNGDVQATFDIAQILGIFEAPKNLTITYYYTDINGCQNSVTQVTQIRPDYDNDLSFSGLPNNPCQDDLTEYTLIPLLNGNPLDMATIQELTFDGPGVVNKGGGQFVFIPNVAGNGLHTINLRVVDIFGCSGGVSQQVTIGEELILGIGSVYCKTDAGVPLFPKPYGGVLKIEGPVLRDGAGNITDRGLFVQYDPIAPEVDPYTIWEPTNNQAGEYLFTYDYTSASGCFNTRTWSVLIVDTPDPSFTIANRADNDQTYCLETGFLQLVPTVKGGRFIRIDENGVITNLGSVLDTRVMGYGIHTVQYRIGSATCFDIEEKIVRIQPPTPVDFNLEVQYCSRVLDKDGNIVDNIVEIKAINPDGNDLDIGVNGTFYSEILPITPPPGNLDPNYKDFLKDNGNNTAIIYPYKVDGPFVKDIRVWFTYTDKNGCVNTIEKTTTVYNVVNVSFATENGRYAFCKNEPPVKLVGSFASTSDTKLSGVFSSDLLSADELKNNTKNFYDGTIVPDGTAILDPSKMDPGIHPIRYTYTSEQGCMAYFIKEVEIYDVPNKYEVVGDPYYCRDDAGSRIGLAYAQAGVTYQLMYEGNLPPMLEFKPAVDGPFYFKAKDGAGNYTNIDARVKAGTYTVRGKTDNSCYEMMLNSFTVIENNVDITISKQDIQCKGTNDGIITITAVGGLAPYGYTYSLDNGATYITPVSGNEFINLAPGSYFVKAIDQIGCESQPVPVEITEPAIAIEVVTVPGSLRKVGCTPCSVGGNCEGAIEISIKGGSPFDNSVVYPSGYQIEWFRPLDPTGYALMPEFDNRISASKLSPGDYYARITDSRGCSFNHLFTIEREMPLTIQKNPQPNTHVNNVCFNGMTGSFEFIVTGGSKPGDYIFTLNDQYVMPKPLATDPADPLFGYYRYENLKAGQYTVAVFDKNYPRCMVTLLPQVEILQPVEISAVVENMKPQSCQNVDDGQFELLATGGVAPYEYSNDGTNWQVSQLFTGLKPGTYTVFVRDANQCVKVLDPITVLPANDMTALVSLVTPVKCFGESTGVVAVDVKGGVQPYSYQWYRKDGTLLPGQIMAQASGLPSGDYYVVVTDHSNCSIASLMVNVPQPATKLSFDVVVTEGFVGCDCDPAKNECEGAARVVVNNTGGTASYSVLWSTGDTGTQVDNLPAGDYSVTVTNDNGCAMTQLFSIGQNGDLNLDELARKAVSCAGRLDGEAQVLASGGSGVYEFRIIRGASIGNWEPADTDALGNPTAVKTFKNLSAATYAVEVRDANYNRCSLVLSGIEITSPAPIEATRTTIDASCYSASDGVINIHATGGWSVYQYSIDNGATFQASNQFSGLEGSLVGRPYYVVVADAADQTCLKVVGPTYIYKPNELVISDVQITPESCANQGDARLVVNYKGGWGTINNPQNNITVPNYSIDNGNNWQALNQFSGLIAGDYTIRVKDANASSNCEVSKTVTILPVNEISAELVDKTPVSCYGTATGQFSVRSIPVGATLEYRVSRGMDVIQDWTTQSTFKGLTAGTYDVSVRRNSCYAFDVLKVEISEPASSVSIDNIDVKDVTCPGGSDGQLTATVSGGTAPYTYLWIKLPINNSVPKNGGDADNERSGLVAGDYQLTVIDANRCMVSQDVRVTAPAAWNVEYAVTPVSVLGEANGKIEITSVSGGTPPYSITWADGAAFNGNYTRNALAVGTYTYTITDSRGCSTSELIAVPDNRALSVNIDWVDIKCHGSNSGEISVLILNGQPGFTIAWNGPSSGQENNYPGDKLYRIVNLPAGTYAIQITDLAGATIERVITIRQPFYPLAVNAGIIDKQCYESGTGTVLVNVSGGTPFEDAGGNKYYLTDVLPGFAGLTANPLKVDHVPSGTYQVRVTDANGCVLTEEVVVETYPALSLGPITINPITCSGENNGSIEVTSVAGSTTPIYVWEYLDASNNWQPLASAVGNRVEQLSAGTYRVTVTQIHPDNACFVTSGNLVVTQPKPITVSHTKVDVVSCQGDNTGKILVKASGGSAPYFFSLNGGPDIASVDGDMTFSNLVAGSYLINVTDQNGCSFANNPIAVMITEPQAMQMVLFNALIDCDNNNSGEVSFELTGGVVRAGRSRYEVSVNGPVNKFLYVDNDYSTATGRVVVNFDMLPEGDYVVTVKDLFSSTPDKCSLTKAFSLALLKIDAQIVAPICESNQNGSINVLVTGHLGTLAYSWKKRDGAGNYQPLATTQNLVNLSAGDYQLTVTDPVRGCSVVKSYSLSYQKVLSVNGAIQHERCYGANDGAITNVVVSGVIDPLFNWTGPNGFVAATADINNLEPGTYVLTVVDPASSCWVAKDFEVTAATPISYSLTKQQVTCDPYVYRINVVGLAGGVAPYKYSWSGPGAITVDANGNATNLTKGGVYTVSIADQRGCLVQQSLAIPYEIKLSAVADQLDCAAGNNGFVDLTVEGGSGSFSYQWTKNLDATVISTQQDIDNLTSGVYKVTVTDLVEGCVKTSSYEIFEPTPITITGALTHVTCFGNGDGKIVATTAGGKIPYTYSWSNGASTKDLSGLSKGNYTLVVTDANGCTANKTFRIYEPDPVDFDLVVKTPVACDGTGASISIENLRGGWLMESGVIVNNNAGVPIHTPVYDIVWAGPAIVDGNRGQTELHNLTSGTYVVTITDASAGRNSCQVTKSVYLPKPLRLDYQVGLESCAGINNGTITLNVTGGVDPYDFTWTTADGFGLDAKAKDQIGLSAGLYTVSITDARTPGCVLTQDILVGREHVLDVKGAATNVSCFGEQSGSILLNVSGGSGDYAYQWTGTGSGVVPNSKDQNTLSVGSYSVTVTDNVLGCETTQSFVINAPLSPLAISQVVVTDVLCKGDATGAIEISVVGGTKFVNGTYQYNWNGPGVFTNSSRQENLIAGIYNVVVTDRNGCTVSSTNIEVREPALQLGASVDFVQDVSAFRGNDGEIQIIVSGGSGAYNIQWSGVPERPDTPIGTLVNNATRQTNLVAGVYQAIITDLNGCSVVLDNIIVRQPGSELDLVIKKKDVRPCNNDVSGQIDVSVVGGKLPYVIRLYNAAGVQIGGDVNGSSAIFNGLVPGVYKVSTLDANKVYVNREVVITEPPVLSLTPVVVQNIECYGATTGAFSLTVNGGLPVIGANNYRVVVTGPAGFVNERTNFVPGVAQQYTGLTAGVYNILVVDDSNGNGVFDANTDCSQSVTLTLTQPEAQVALSGVDDICIGGSAQIKFVVSNWNAAANPLTVTLSDGSVVVVNDSPFMHTVTPVASTVYAIQSVTDAGGCAKGTFSGQADVTVRPLPTARVYGDSEVCLGDQSTVAIDLTGTAPWRIEIFDGTNMVPVTNISKSPYLHTFTPSVDQTITVLSVSDAHCVNTGEGSVTVKVNELPAVSISGEKSICYGDQTDVVFTFNAGTAPYKVSYTVNGIMYHVPNIIPDMATKTHRISVQPGATTTYELNRVEDAHGCVRDVTGSIVVSVRPLPGVPGAIGGNALVCQGEKGVVYSISTVANATNYEWTVPAGAVIVSGMGSESITVDFANDYAGGVFSVVAVNSCGTSAPSEKLISASELPGQAGMVSGPAELCQGAQGVQYSVVPVVDASTYVWTLPIGFNIVAGDGTANIIVDLDPAVDVLDGIIRVLPVNSCGQGVVSPDFNVSVTPLPVAFAGHDANDLCANVYQLQANPPRAGEQGLWTIVKGSGVIAVADRNNPNAMVTNLSQGENILVWRVENSTTKCFVTDEVRIYNNRLNVEALVEQRVVCDGTAEVQGTRLPMNTTGVWSFVEGSGIIVSPTENLTQIVQLSPDRSVVRWTIDQNGCQSFAEVEIVNNQPDEAVIDGEVFNICDDKITLTANTPVEGKGFWTRINGLGIIDDQNAAQINVTGLSKGENIFRYTIVKGGCKTFDEVVVYNNMLDVDAGSDVTTCDDFVTMRAKAAPAGTSAHWEIIPGEGSGVFENGNDPQTRVTNLGPGENKFMWIVNKNGCISSDIVVITSNKPTNAITGSQQVVCGSEAQLLGNDGVISGKGFWSIVSGSGVFDDPTKGKTMVRNLQQGTSVFRWNIVNNGCVSFADQVVENLQVYTNAGKDTSICSNTTTLRANIPQSGQTGEWTLVAGMGGATIVNSTDPYSRVGGLAPGATGFVWTIMQKSCVSRDTVIVYNSRPFEVNAGPDQVVSGTTSSMAAVVPSSGKGSWSLVAGGGTIVDPLNPFTQINNLRRGDNIFRWTVRNNNCEEYDDVIITNGQTIDANAGENRVVCENFVTLHANDPDVGIGEWSVVQGSGDIEDPYNPKSRVTKLGRGENIFRWSIHYTNSVSTDEVTITNNEPDKANGGPRTRVICGDTHTMEGNTPLVGSPKWTILSGGGVFADDTNPNSLVTNLAKGWNKFKYEIINKGCPSVDTVSVLNDLPDEAYAGEDDVVCNSRYELKPNNPTHGVGEWRVVEGSAKFEGNFAIELAQGRNVLAWVIRGTTETCYSRDEVVVVNNEPSLASAGVAQDICATETRLSATAPLNGVGKWTLLYGSGILEDEFSRTSRVTGLALGVNRFRWTVDNNGCTSSHEVEIRNNYIESVAGVDRTLCIDTLVLSANNPAPGVGTWGVKGGSGQAVFANPNDPFTTVRSLDRGDNVLTWTIMHKGCPSVSEIVITNNMPSTANAGSNQTLCDKNYTVLNASKPVVGTGKWTIRSGGGSILDDGANSTNLTNVAFGDNIFNWRVEHKGCYSEDDVLVSYNRIEASAGPSEIICSDEYQLEANNAFPGEGTWSVVGGTSQAQFLNQNDPTTKVTGLAKGKNRLRWTIDYRGCVTSEELEIQNDMPSRAYAGNSIPICEDHVVLDATPVDVGVGSWSVLTGSGTIANELDPKTAVTKLSKGDNVFRWTVQNNDCKLTDDVRITNNLPSVPYAGRDEEVCENSFTLKANPAEFGSGLWSINQGSGNFSNPLSPNSRIDNLSEGVNILRWTLTQGQCTVFDEVVLTNNSAIQAKAGPDIDDCKDFAVLDANIPSRGEGRWSLVSGKGTFEDPLDARTTVRNLGFGENVLLWTITNGKCFTTDQVIITNRIPDQANAGTDRVICEDYLTLNANNPSSGIGSWSVVSGKGVFDDLYDNRTIVRGVGYGENVYRWTVTYGTCTTTDEVVVVSQKADPYAGEDDITYVNSYELKAGNPGSIQGKWKIVAGNGRFADDTYYNTMVYDLHPGNNTFRWTINTDDCEAFDDVVIQYKEVPEAGFAVDVTEGCMPLKVRFTDQSIGAKTYHWDFNDGTTTDIRNPIHTFELPGNYNVVLTVPGPDGKDTQFSKLIKVYDHPKADFDAAPTLVFLPDDVVRFRNFSIDAVKWSWTFGDGGLSEEKNPEYRYSDEGWYTISLNVWNQYGCEDKVTKTDFIEARRGGFITFPNAFRPRPDGGGGDSQFDLNAIFKPVHQDVDDYHLQIFNRWGQLIFETRDINQGWNGFFGGQMAAQGVYVWVATGRFISGKEFSKTGHVLLAR